MDPRLLSAYNDELAYLREAAGEFAAEHEAVAGRLGLDAPTDPDPYVERLLEGVAFLGARVQLKLQDQFPDFTKALLQAVQPQYLAPTPSICVAAFEPAEGDPALVTGCAVPRWTAMTAIAGGNGDSPVLFRSGHDVTLWPVRIVQAEYLATRAAVAGFAAAAGVTAEAGLRLRFEAIGGAALKQLAIARLPLYLAGAEATPGELYRQIIGDTIAVIARDPASGAGAAGWTPLPKPDQVGFGDDEALLPADLRSFRGYRLLAEYFACPERFLFVALRDLGRAFAAATAACDVVLLFRRATPSLAGAVAPGNFRLFATPAINLFEKQLGRVSVDARTHEHHVVPDRTRPLDFEVFRLLEVQAFGADNREPREVAPLYALGAQLHDWRDALFYTTRLTARRLSTREQRLRRRTDYVGTETWISLTAPGDAARLDGVRELGVRALVTNRELPELLTFGGEHHLQASGVPARTISILRSPTRPRLPMGLSDAAWQVIGHLTPNYLSLATEQGEGEDATVLRDHLALYGRTDDAAARRQVNGVLGVTSRPITRRVGWLDRTAVARGQQIRVRLDDGAFDRGRMFLFGAVVERFLAEFATVNAFTETQFHSADEGEIIAWPARIGRRRLI